MYVCVDFITVYLCIMLIVGISLPMDDGQGAPNQS